MTFKPVQFEKTTDLNRVVRLDENKDPVVSQFQFGKVGKKLTYEEVRAKFGPLASSDDTKTSKTQKDQRFEINEFAKERLSIEDEDRRHMDEEIERRMVELKEQASKQGYEDGLKQGIEIGKQESFEALKKQQAENTEAFEKLLASMNGLKQELYSLNEDYLLKLVYKMGRMILLKELTTDKDYLMRLARNLVERVGVRDHIRIKINPKDHALAGQLRTSLEQALGGLPNLKIETSDAVLRGGCSLETDWNAINASIENQLESVEATLGQADAK